MTNMQKELPPIDCMLFIFDKFSSEIIQNIASFLEIPEILKFGLVCKIFNNSLQNGKVWKEIVLKINPKCDILETTDFQWKKTYLDIRTTYTRRHQQFWDDIWFDLVKKDKIRITIVGDTNVGKTGALIAFWTGTFPCDQCPRVVDEFEVRTAHKKQFLRFTFQLLDSASRDEYANIRKWGSYVGTTMIIVMYAVNDRISFQNVEKKWLVEIRSVKPGTPFILMANKIDLRNGNQKANTNMVTSEEGKDLAKKIGAVGFYEISAWFDKSKDLEKTFGCIFEIAIADRLKFLGEPIPIKKKECIVS